MTSVGRESSACSSVCLSVTQRYVRLACPAPAGSHGMPQLSHGPFTPPDIVLAALRPLGKAVLGKAEGKFVQYT